tara:strand:- start:372 stop:995 length:624 start_codon:yes stop_codon:yes gene_type:complete
MLEQKEKKCKGLGIAKGNGCGNMSLERRLGLCRACYPNFLLHTPEGRERVKKHTLKAKEPRESLQKAFQEKKDKTSLQYLKVSTVTWCHRYIKERDKGKPCVSCGQSWSLDHQAGHWKKASDYSTLKFDENNIHNQCRGCNLLRDGNVQKYGDRIRMRISEEQKEEIERKCREEKQKVFKWERTELEELRNHYKKKYHLEKVKNLEK